MTQHTPGPWMVSGVRCRINREQCHFVLRYDETAKKDEQIAAVWYDPKTNLGWADARLIAAAPDLLKALINTAGHLAAAISLLEAGGKAAKKAAPSDKMFDQMLKDYKASLSRAHAAIAKATGKP
jgi:hypothetical protein